jgi:capsular exopolysaccharide synthesis family protein
MPKQQAEDRVGAPDLRDYGLTLWKQRWTIVLTLVVAVVVAVALSLLQAPVYKGTADIIIQPSATEQILNSSPQNAQDAARNVDTEVAVLQSNLVEDAAKKRMGHEPDISVSSSPTSDVVKISARSTNARRAAADATGYANAYVAVRRNQSIGNLLLVGEKIQARLTDIDTRLASLPAGSSELAVSQQRRIFLQQQLDQLQLSTNLDQAGGARVLAKAEVPTSPDSPKPVRNVVIAVALGLLLGIGLAFLREHLDDSISTREQLEQATDLPVLAQIPRVTGWRERDGFRVVTLDEPNSPAAEGYRSLRTAVAFLSLERAIGSIQFTSAQANEGKTTVLANVAVALARSGRNVTVVCCDLRRPRIHEFFDLENGVGFTSLLLGNVSVSEALQRVPGEANLTLLAAGPPPPNPSELLSSPLVPDVLTSVAHTSDLLLIDSPAVLPVSDALVVSRMVDATVLVASAKMSSRRALRRAIAVLRQVNAPLVGAVLNNAEHLELYGTYAYGDASVTGRANGHRGARSDARKGTPAAP